METATGIGQGQENLSSPGGVQGTQTQNVTPAPVSEERFFKQSEVNDIVKKAKYGAVEDYKRLQSEQPNYFSQKYGEANVNQQHQQQPYHSVNENDIRKIAAEEAQRLREQSYQEARTKSEAENAERIVKNFTVKINQGRDKYQDFDKVVSDMDMSRFPNVVQILADYVENSHDILYELARDRTKLAGLENLANLSPRDAIVQAQRLSKSIKDNESASDVRIPNEPLSQLRPTNTGTGSNGALSWSDLKRKYKG